MKKRLKACCKKAVEERLNTPETKAFLKAVRVEAAHQARTWQATDPRKTSADWYWLIGWLGGKVVTDPHEESDARTPRERRLHRIVTVAAAAYHWHQAVLNRNT